MPENVTWPMVAYALIVALPGIIAAFYSHRNSTSLKTGNEKTVGEMVTEGHGRLSEQGTPYDTHGRIPDLEDAPPAPPYHQPPP